MDLGTARGQVSAHALTERPERYAPLGRTMVERGLLSPEQLEWALETHGRTGARLGRVVLAAGLVRRQALYEVLADLWGCGFVDLLRTPVDARVTRLFDPEQMAREGWIATGIRAGQLLVATSEPPTDELAHRIVAAARANGAIGFEHVEFAATTDWDVHAAIRTVFRYDLADGAAYGLAKRQPLQSALGGLNLGQRLCLLTLPLGIVAGALVDPAMLLVASIVALQSAFIVSVAFKLIVSIVGWGGLRSDPASPAPERLAEDELPFYTVLVPVYREANVVGGLIGHLRQLDYPREKLEILLLMEEDDLETIEAARAADPPDTVRFILIPAGEPRTKPRACNVGLFFARGDYLVIYDAEDRPEPGQLRDAVAAFHAGPDELVCVQARLNYFNAFRNLLTRMFTLEYSYWFDYMLPGLDRLRLPIPLGGTSNHFRTELLRALGGWDAFNVTEDADLGLRASAKGYTVGVIESTTYEEACSRLFPWIRQRTRWIKGYMQTTLVHTRRPIAFARQTKLHGVAGFLLLIAGTPATFLVTPILWLLTTLWVLGLTTGVTIPHLFPHPFDVIGEISFFIGNAAMILLNALAVCRRRLYRLLPYALLCPLYWVLHSIAAWRALVQLVTRPFYWEKTPHGLDPPPT
jgi:cellulose synthase/poly-beta-1,6-N-acetylglucosamine synthase-like glycosyltransferase